MTKDVIETFFDEIDSEIKAYLLGFYLGDGCLSKGRFKISVQDKDLYIIQLYQKHISPNSKITYEIINREGYNTKPSYSITFQRKYLKNRLEELGYGTRKTYIKKHIPNLNNDLFIHFLRGYFDADGSINVSFAKRFSGRQKGYQSLLRNFQITSKDLNILLEIKEKLYKDYNINVSTGTYKKASVLYTCNLKTISNIYNIFYNNANFFLERKKLDFEFTMKTSREIRDIKNSNPCNA